MLNGLMPHYCLCCPKWINKNGKEKGQELEITETNYSGCGVDIWSCPECGRGFQISYKVDKITRAEDWDGETMKEREANEIPYREQLKQHEINEAKKILIKYGVNNVD